MESSTPLDELAGFLSGNAATSVSPQNPLNQNAEPSANPSNPNMNPSNPNAWANPSNPQLNPNLPGAVTNPSNPKYNPAMPGATNNPSNYQYNPQMPGSMTNPASPSLNPNYPGSVMNPANPIHNPNYPVHAEIPRPPGLSDNASLPPAHAAVAQPPWWDPSKESWDQGPYWHVTTNPNFQIDPKLGPTDASTIGSGGMTPGAFMFTNDPEHWLGVFHSHPEDEYDEDERPKHPRQWAAEIVPQGQMGQTNQEGSGDWWPVNRGFGAEYYMPDSSKAQVKRVIPVEQMIAEQRQRDAENERYLVDYWNNKAGSRREAWGLPKPGIPQAIDPRAWLRNQIEQLRIEAPEMVDGSAALEAVKKTIAEYQAELAQLEAKTADYWQKAAVTLDTSGDSEMTGYGWAERAPAIYNPSTDTLHVGPQGWTHPQLMREVMGVKPPMYRDETEMSMGWYGPNPEAWPNDYVFNRGRPNEIGWYGVTPRPPAAVHKQLADYAQQNPIRPVSKVAAWHVADNYTQDTREWPDPTEPRSSMPPAPRGCTCRNGTDSVSKLHCPVHGLDGQWEEAMDWSLPEGHPVGYPQDQPRSWVDAVHSSVPSKLPSKPAPVKPNKFLTTKSQHVRAKRKWRWFKPRQAVISPESMHQWMQSEINAPYLYHSTTHDNAEAILRDGLHPHDQIEGNEPHLMCPNCGHTEPEDPDDWEGGGVGEPCPNCGDDYLKSSGPSSYIGQFYEPRPGHTYMGNFGLVKARYFNPRANKLLRIDMRKLDPSKINPDEDAFDMEYQREAYPAVQKVMEHEPIPTAYDHAHGGITFGQWADMANLGQNPEETHHSLFNHGSIAYNDVVPPGAIELADPATGMAQMPEQQAA